VSLLNVVEDGGCGIRVRADPDGGFSAGAFTKALPNPAKSLPSADPGFTSTRLRSGGHELEVLEMNKIHVTVVSLILGLSAALGIAAASDTVGLRASGAPSASKAQLAAREKRLAKAELAIRKARRSKPPALPAVPAARASAGPVAQRAAPAASSSHGDDDDDDFGDDHGGHGHGGDDHGGDDD
jgi:hypothetical protein